MKVIGLTGLIGSGKSLIAEYLHDKYGYLIIDVDKLGHELLKEPKITRKLLELFGTAERSQLAQLVFADPNKLKQLNTLLHPLMYAKVQLVLAEQPAEQVIIEAAVLFTIGLDRLCDKVILVEAAQDIALQRLVQRGLSRDQALQRLAANDVQRYRSRCEVITNNGSAEELYTSITSALG